MSSAQNNRRRVGDSSGDVFGDQIERSALKEFSDFVFVALGDHELNAVRAIFSTSAKIVRCDSVSESVLQEMHCGEFSCLIVVSLAKRLTVAFIDTMMRDLADLRSRTGLISGRTPDAIKNSLSKLIRVPQNASSTLEVFDGIVHQLDQNVLGNSELLQKLRTPTRTLILRCHGEGSHAKLPGVTICGSLDDHEFPDYPEIGCARIVRRCKRAPSNFGGQVIFGREIPAQTVFFLCCNGFNLASELYPSPVSIALSMIEGQAETVIAPTRPVIMPDSLLQWLVGRVRLGGRAGDIVAELNSRMLLLEGNQPFVLHGNPRAVLDSCAAPKQSSKGPNVYLVPMSDVALKHAKGARRWCVELKLRTLHCSHILNTLGALAPELELRHERASLADMQRLILFCLSHLDKIHDEIELKIIDRNLTILGSMVQRLDLLLAKKIVGARKLVDPYDLFHFGQARKEEEERMICDRCETPTRVLRYGKWEPFVNERIAIDCPVCGPKIEARGAGLVVEVESKVLPVWRNSKPILNLQFKAKSESGPLVTFAAIAFSFFDKAKDECVASFEDFVEVNGVQLDRSIGLPNDMSPDLHSLRLVSVSGLDFSYNRIRLSGGPPLFESN